MSGMVAIDTGLQTALRVFLSPPFGAGDYADVFTQDFGRPGTYDAASRPVAPGQKKSGEPCLWPRPGG
jgi:hypothetical protein